MSDEIMKLIAGISTDTIEMISGIDYDAVLSNKLFADINFKSLSERCPYIVMIPILGSNRINFWCTQNFQKGKWFTYFGDYYFTKKEDAALFTVFRL